MKSTTMVSSADIMTRSGLYSWQQPSEASYSRMERSLYSFHPGWNHRETGATDMASLRSVTTRAGSTSETGRVPSITQRATALSTSSAVLIPDSMVWTASPASILRRGLALGATATALGWGRVSKKLRLSLLSRKIGLCVPCTMWTWYGDAGVVKGLERGVMSLQDCSPGS